MLINIGDKYGNVHEEWKEARQIQWKWDVDEIMIIIIKTETKITKMAISKTFGSNRFFVLKQIVYY